MFLAQLYTPPQTEVIQYTETFHVSECGIAEFSEDNEIVSQQPCLGYLVNKDEDSYNFVFYFSSGSTEFQTFLSPSRVQNNTSYFLGNVVIFDSLDTSQSEAYPERIICAVEDGWDFVMCGDSTNFRYYFFR